jgi:hypothetical protein
MMVGRTSSLRAFNHSVLAEIGNYLAEVFDAFGWIRDIFIASPKLLLKVFNGAFYVG